MKIIQVCPRYYPDIGGVETHVKEISDLSLLKGEIGLLLHGSSRSWKKIKEMRELLRLIKKKINLRD